MILLDTNICFYLINARPPEVLQRFHQYRMGENDLRSVVAAELAYGVAKSGSLRNRQALEMFLAPLSILPFDAGQPSGLTAICLPSWNPAAHRSVRSTP